MNIRDSRYKRAAWAGIYIAFSIVLLCAAKCPAAEPNAPAGFFAMEPAKDDFGPTVLDCSRLIEAPTGKHGFVTVKGENFVFEDGTPVRFWGAQMGGGRDKEKIEYTIRRMRRQGINITRMHGLNFLIDRNGKTSTDYSKEGFDRLDYLIAKLGENGIYIILDTQYPLVSRFKSGDNIAGLPQGGPAPYAQFFNDKVISITRRNMVDIYTHLNPYTNKRYCDDPTLAMIEIANEDSLFWGMVPDNFKGELEEKFTVWLRTRYGNNGAMQKAWTVDGKSPLKAGEGIDPNQRIGLMPGFSFNSGHLKENPQDKVRGLDQMRFYYELEDKYWLGCRDAMRKAGVKAPISATNWQGHEFATRIHMLAQSKLDYVDRHGYWDHPQGEGNLKWQIATCLFHNLPMIKDVKANKYEIKYLGVGNLVTDKAWEQVLGLPMTISEWNTCLPNQYSLEGTGLMAAYGLLQGWDGSLEFGYFSPDWQTKLGSGSFDMFGNPPQILQFPAVATMWHRGDVKQAELVAESVYTPQSAFEWSADKKPLPLAAALVGKVGYRFVDANRPPVIKDISKWWDADKLLARSITGELTWDAKNGVVHIDTPRTQAVIGFLSAQPHGLTDVQIESATNFGALYVTAMDGDSPIAAAKHLLITAVGPARNTDMEYEKTTEKSEVDDAPFWRLKKEGGAPLLLEAVTGRVAIRCQQPDKMKCWILNIVGKRGEQVPLSTEKNAVALTMQPEHKTVYYEISAE
jgi:hypothetical protein